MTGVTCLRRALHHHGACQHAWLLARLLLMGMHARAVPCMGAGHRAAQYFSSCLPATMHKFVLDLSAHHLDDDATALCGPARGPLC